MNDIDDENLRSISKTLSDRKSVDDDVRASSNRNNLNTVHEDHPTGPEVESEKNPFVRSISPIYSRTDSARHVITDSNIPHDKGSHECPNCGMEFKQIWLLEFHKNRLCCGYVSQEDVERITSVQNGNILRQSTPIEEGKEAIRNKILEQDKKKVRWVACSDGNVAQFAVKAGYDTVYKCDLYVCRAIVENQKVPGQVVPTHNCAFVTVNGREVKVTDYDVLTDPQNRLSWKPCPVKGAMPRGTQVGGYDDNKLMLFIARGRTPDGNHCSGKYIPHEQKCLFAWQGQEMSSDTFDFLCKNYIAATGAPNNGFLVFPSPVQPRHPFLASSYYLT